MNRCAYVMLVLLLLVAPPLEAECGREVIVKSAVPVYDAAPTFYSASGWKSGNVLENLPPNTHVFICEEKSVGLFVGKKTWYRIHFANGRSGWVFADQLLALRSDPNRTISIALVSEALAADGEPEGSGIPAAGTPEFGRIMMVLAALVFVLLGIMGKVVFDAVDSSPELSIWACVQVKKCIKALIAAPLAFLAFLNLANFGFSNEVAVAVFLCMAFQNGFFWQTLVPTQSGKIAGGPAGVATRDGP